MTDPYKPSTRPLVLFPDSKLYEVSQAVSFRCGEKGEWFANLDEFAQDLAETMKSAQGVGLSAIQVGIPTRVFVMMFEGTPLTLVNPVWYPSLDAKMVLLNEGCLSFPAVFEEVNRLDSVEVDFQDVTGEHHEKRFTGMSAHVVQHETEHLDGHLFIEHLPQHKRDSIRQKMKQRERLGARISKLMAHGGPQSLDALVRAGVIKTARR